MLDSFRGLAILWIACFHILAGVRENYGDVISYLISNGYLGMQVFFVISGYGIAESLSSSKVYFFKQHLFLLRRLRKIYFGYWWHFLFAALVIPFLCAIVSALKTHSFSMNLSQYSILEWFQIVTLTNFFSANSWDLHFTFVPLNGVHYIFFEKLMTLIKTGECILAH